MTTTLINEQQWLQQLAHAIPQRIRDINWRGVKWQPRTVEFVSRLVVGHPWTTSELEVEQLGVGRSTSRAFHERLARARVLSSTHAVCSQVVRCDAPELEYFPGDPTPDFGALSYRVNTHWQRLPARRRRLYSVSNKLLDAIGLPPRRLSTHFTHDLATRAAFVWCRKAYPAATVVHESMYRHLRPADSVVEDFQVLGHCRGDILGRYSAERIAELHHHLEDQPYLLFAP